MEYASLAVSFVGALIALGALIASRRSAKAAENANEIAEDGHRVAQGAADSAIDAVSRADQANGNAIQANQLADDANAIAKRAFAVAEDDIQFSWGLEIDDERGTVSVINDCAYEANDVSVVVDTRGEVIATTAGHAVLGFDQLMFDVQSTLDEHLEHVAERPPFEGGTLGDFVMMSSAGEVVETPFRASIAWTTAAGVRRTTLCEELLRHRQDVGGVVVRLDSD